MQIKDVMIFDYIKILQKKKNKQNRFENEKIEISKYLNKFYEFADFVNV